MIALAEKPPGPTLADFQSHPPEDQEWVEGRLIEKKHMTILHSKVQSNLAFLWKKYLLESGQGGEVYVELPCITTGRGRRPDICYATAELVAQFGRETVLPQSPSLAAEIASPNDSAEELFAKAAEYLASGCAEVWLVFPENCRVLTYIPQVAAIDSVIHLNYACGSVLVRIYAPPVEHLFVLLRSI